MTTLTIGKVAKAAGLGVETVRFYERQGLIAEPARSDSGYRQYGPETIRRLQFIVRAKALGFTLQEIGDLLDLRATQRWRTPLPSSGTAPPRSVDSVSPPR